MENVEKKKGTTGPAQGRDRGKGLMRHARREGSNAAPVRPGLAGVQAIAGAHV